MFEIDLSDYLLSRPEIEALVHGAIWPLALPQSPAIPAIVFTDVTTRPNYSQTGDSNLDEVLMQFDVWAKTPLDAKSLADRLRIALNGMPGRRGFMENRTGRQDAETGLFRETLDVRFWTAP